MTAPTGVIRTSVFKDQYQAGEINTVFGTYDSWSKAKPRGIVWVHGSGETAMSVFQFEEQYKNMKEFGYLATAVSGDYGFQTWGNNTVIDRIDHMIDYMIDEFGVEEPVILAGASMGACNCMNYLRVHPERVIALALVIPLCDINTIYPIAPGDIDAAYPPDGWSEAVYGATHNPATFAPTLDPTVPIRLWYVVDDPLVQFQTVLDFAAAAPNATAVNLGGGAHTNFTIGKAGPEMIAWIKERFEEHEA